LNAFIKSFKAEIAKKIKESESGYIIDDKTALELYYVYIYEKNLVDDFEKYKENLIKGKLKNCIFFGMSGNGVQSMTLY